MERIQWKRNTMVPSSDSFCPLWMLEKLRKLKRFMKVFHNIALLHLYRLKFSVLYRC